MSEVVRRCLTGRCRCETRDGLGVSRGCRRTEADKGGMKILGEPLCPFISEKVEAPQVGKAVIGPLRKPLLALAMRMSGRKGVRWRRSCPSSSERMWAGSSRNSFSAPRRPADPGGADGVEGVRASPRTRAIATLRAELGEASTRSER